MPVFSKRMLLKTFHNQKGFTLLELAVASAVALGILSVALGMLAQQRGWMLSDRTRATANDNLRLASDLIGQDIKQAGERLESDTLLPSISIIPGASTSDPSMLVLQRQLLTEVLPVCQNITAGTSTIDVSVKTGSAIANCVYSYTAPTGGEPSTALTTLQPTNNLRAWRTFRCTQDAPAASATSDPCTAATSSARAWAYIHDPSNNRGEFFQYDLEQEGACVSSTLTTRTCQKIRRVGSTWQYSYSYSPTATTLQPRLYLLEERRYNLVADTSTSRTDDFILQLSINRQTPRRVANQIRNFQVWAKVPNAYTSAPFSAPTNWGCAVSGTDPATAPNPAAPNQWYCRAFNVNIPITDPVQRLQALEDWQDLQGIRMTLTGINPNEQALKVNTASVNNLLRLSSEFLPRNVASR